MAKRKVKKTTRKAVKKRTVKRRKPVSRKRSKKSAMKSAATNKKALWASFKHLRSRVDHAWSKLKSDVKRKASPQVINRGKNHLLLLLGECNYMAREYMRSAHAKRRR